MFIRISDKAAHLAPMGVENEDAAIRQLRAAAEMEGVRQAAGFPDLTPGKGGPVGAALLSDAVHPVFVGGDLGCAYSLFSLDLKPRRLGDPAKLLEAMDGLDLPMPEAERTASMVAQGIERIEGMDEGFGTHGLGNHFTEIQRCAHVHDPDSGLVEGAAFLLVHTGSRAMGDAVFRRITAVHGGDPLDPGSEDGRRWIEEHDHCVRWASASRQVIADRVCAQLGCNADLVLDLAHNVVERVEYEGSTMWLHRKGAAPATKGLSVLAGSRETPSFLVRPLPSPAIALQSLAHGAGRRLSRSAAGATTKRPSTMRSAPALSRGNPGPMVACGRNDLLAEERGDAYKEIHGVLSAMLDIDLCEVVAEMHPVATFKVSEGSSTSPRGKIEHFRKNEKQRHAERDRERSEKRDRR